MKILSCHRANKLNYQALTLVELLVIIAVITILAGFLLPRAGTPKGSRIKLQCASNLKQVGLAFRIWQGDHGDHFPMQTLTNSGCAMLYANSAEGFRCFQVMSNELPSPRVLVCPADPQKNAATNFTSDFNGSHVSYFLGLTANPAFPNSFLAGDPNITNALAAHGGVLELTSNQIVSWNSGWHENGGNIGLADGSVHQFTTSALKNALQETGLATNRLLLP